MAVQLLSFTWAGRAFGESGVHLWGSERDILHGSESITLRLLNWISNNVYLNAYRMTPEHMRGFLALLNERRPKLIIAYAQSIYELAQFAEREQIAVAKQSAIVTSSEMLHPFMRAKVEQIFGCMIYDRYGCREVGDIASECQAHAGMHVFPWTNYVEIVDDQGMPVPAGVEGNILVTCLTNAAMPMIRYDIGDRGVLSSSSTCSCGRSGQILARVLGRDTDQIRRRDGTLIDEGYFSGFLSYKDWVRKYQIIQKDYDRIVYRIVKAEADYAPHELDEIVDGIRTLMGAECRVEFEFLDDIPASSSGKYRYTISEVPQHSEPATRH
jgi:phenylacetate-CoA ligase